MKEKDLNNLHADREFVARKLAAAQSDRWGTARLMWEQRLAELASQMGKAAEAASRNARVSLVFKGKPVIAAHAIQADFANRALREFGLLLKAVYASQSKLHVPRRGPTARFSDARLHIVDLVRGSMGFVLEEVSDQKEIIGTVMRDVVEKTTSLIQDVAEAEDAGFEETISKFDHRSLGCARRFFANLRTNGAELTISTDDLTVEVDEAKVFVATERLSTISVGEEQIRLYGRLNGILPLSMEFEFIGKDSSVLTGVLTDELVRKYVGEPTFVDQFILKDIVATLVRRTTMRLGRIVAVQWRLLSVDLVDQSDPPIP